LRYITKFLLPFLIQSRQSRYPRVPDESCGFIRSRAGVEWPDLQNPCLAMVGLTMRFQLDFRKIELAG
tara:strand:- start:23714 stop:23917 length:204 start_codon:yes stop_codon:yes gene_type:complete